MEFEASKRAIAQIHFANSDVIAGTGFLVAEAYLVTCAHVVREALYAPEKLIGASLSVTFFNTSKPQPAEVIFYDFVETSYGRDVAVLYLSDAAQRGASLAQLKPLRQLQGAELNVFGYPGNDAAGRNLTAVTRGEVSGGWVQIEDTKVPGLSVEAGFSGSPVWCNAAQGIVGMVVARHQGQGQEKVGFMIPMQQLQLARQSAEQHALFALLSPHQDALSDQITAAYRVCRPHFWAESYQTELVFRLTDMATMSPQKLFEFVACLLNQPGVQTIQADLIAWFDRYKRDGIELSALLSQMREQQDEKATNQGQVFEPRLLVKVQADKTTKGEPYQVNAWVVPDSRRYKPATGEGYDPATGTGAQELMPQDWHKYVDQPDSIDLTAGVRYGDLPILLADYLDQVASRGVAFQTLTVELFLPFPLINEAVEQCCIPVEFGFPAPLGIDQDCAHVVVRSQERLEFARGLVLWEAKWNRLQNELSAAAKDAFVDGDRYSARALQAELKQALGLRLTQRLPLAANQGEIGLILATGTPAAIWLRCSDPDLVNRLHDDVLNDCLAQVPENVCSLRRNTAALDEEAEPESPIELGHHLSFLWEDFYRVPPSITYSDSQL